MKTLACEVALYVTGLLEAFMTVYELGKSSF